MDNGSIDKMRACVVCVCVCGLGVATTITVNNEVNSTLKFQASAHTANIHISIEIFVCIRLV